MNQKKKLVIQLHAVASLLGYWFFHAIVILALGSSSTTVSIIYDAIQLLLALYVLFICRRDIVVESGCTQLKFFSLLLVLYTVRMFYDMAFGPFVGQVSTSMYLFDITITVGGTFVSVWAIIAGRKYIDIDKIVRLVFWIGIATAVAVLLKNNAIGESDVYEEGRMIGGQGLTSQHLARLGAIVVMASLHLLLNKEKRLTMKGFYFAGLIISGFLTLASGARGAVAALIVALGVYYVFSTRRSPLQVAMALVSVVLVVINIVPILIWISDYFPIFGQRMLRTILEDDQSGRAEIRRRAWEVTINNPLVGYSYRLFGSESGFRAHNGILEVSIALGIPITILYVYYVYIKGALIAVKNMTNRQLLFPTAMGVFALVASLAASSISNCVFDFAFCILVIACYYNNNLQKISNKWIIQNLRKKFFQ